VTFSNFFDYACPLVKGLVPKKNAPNFWGFFLETKGNHRPKQIKDFLCFGVPKG